MKDFDEFASDYKTVLNETLKISGDDADYFSDYKAAHAARLMGPAFRGTVLDYGCGVGLLSLSLKRSLPGAQLNGCDISAASIAALPQNLKTQGKFTGNLGDQKGPFDLIVAANVLHHVEPARRKKTLSDLGSFLAPGGTLLIFEHNPFNPVTRKVVRDCPFDEGVELLPPAETISYLRGCGLRTRLDYIVFFPKFLAALRPLEPGLGWLPLGAQYAAAGKA